jgi:hypothetical protein
LWALLFLNVWEHRDGGGTRRRGCDGGIVVVGGGGFDVVGGRFGRLIDCSIVEIGVVAFVVKVFIVGIVTAGIFTISVGVSGEVVVRVWFVVLGEDIVFLVG